MRYTRKGWENLQKETLNDRANLFLEEIFVPIGQQMFREILRKNRKKREALEAKGGEISIHSVYQSMRKTPYQLKDDKVLRESVKLYWQSIRLKKLMHNNSILNYYRSN